MLAPLLLLLSGAALTATDMGRQPGTRAGRPGAAASAPARAPRQADGTANATATADADADADVKATRTPLAPAGESSVLEGALLISGSLRIGVSVTDAHGAVTDFISDEIATVTPYTEPAATLLGVLDQASA